ncbi:hypothetical protein [Ruminococcus sp.]
MERSSLVKQVCSTRTEQSNVTVELLTEMFYLLNVILYIVDY